MVFVGNREGELLKCPRAHRAKGHGDKSWKNVTSPTASSWGGSHTFSHARDQLLEQALKSNVKPLTGNIH